MSQWLWESTTKLCTRGSELCVTAPTFTATAALPYTLSLLWHQTLHCVILHYVTMLSMLLLLKGIKYCSVKASCDLSLYSPNRLNLKVHTKQRQPASCQRTSVNCEVALNHRYGCKHFVVQLVLLYLVYKILSPRLLEQSLLLQHVESAGALLGRLLVSVSSIIIKYILQLESPLPGLTSFIFLASSSLKYMNILGNVHTWQRRRLYVWVALGHQSHRFG